MKTLAILITGLCIAMIALTWETSAVFGWIVAVVAWLERCFIGEDRYGNP